MNCFNCDHTFVTLPSTFQCCTLCGVMEPTLALDTYCSHAGPIGRSYDRFVRFQTKIDRLLGIGTVPRHTDPVWAVLEKATMQDPTDVRETLRQSRVVNKHYDCVKIFTDHFTDYRCPRFQVLATKRTLEAMFRDVKNRWGSRDGFFSYDWLLRKFLECMDSPLLVYLKKPTNKRREQKYCSMIRKIYPTVGDDYKMWNHMIAADHSQSV